MAAQILFPSCSWSFYCCIVKIHYIFWCYILIRDRICQDCLSGVDRTITFLMVLCHIEVLLLGGRNKLCMFPLVIGRFCVIGKKTFAWQKDTKKPHNCVPFYGFHSFCSLFGLLILSELIFAYDESKVYWLFFLFYSENHMLNNSLIQWSYQNQMNPYQKSNEHEWSWFLPPPIYCIIYFLYARTTGVLITIVLQSILKLGDLSAHFLLFFSELLIFRGELFVVFCIHIWI